jgi:hypothetical protein
MDTLLETLLSKTPKCLARFEIKNANLSLPTQLQNESHFITKSLSCSCGNEHLYLETARRKELKGVCRQDEIITAIPPVYAGCEQCGRLTLLFDPHIHGWNAETNEPDDSEDALRLMKCTPRSGAVYVTYSYRDVKKYRVLATTGIANPEDYFDTFTVLFRERASEKLREILFSDCRS